MPTITMTPGWAGPLAAVGAPPVVVQVAGVGVPGTDGAAGPNQISDTTALGTLTDAVADALFLLCSNAAGDAAHKITITVAVRSLLQATLTAGRVLIVGAGPSVTDDPGLTFDPTTDTLTVGTATSGLRVSTSGTVTSITPSPSVVSGQRVNLVCRDFTYVFSDGVGNGFQNPTGQMQTGEMRLGSATPLGWSSASNPTGAARDTTLYRASAAVVGIPVSASAPADSALSNGSVVFYSDANGDLKIKLKDSGGTVRTGTVDLS